MVVLQALPEVMSGEIAITVAPLHASLAVGGVNDGVVVHWTGSQSVREKRGFPLRLDGGGLIS